MSGANYEYCLICDNKAVYVGEDDWPEGVAAIHVKCNEDAIATAVAAERARLFAELGSDHYVIFTEDRWTVEHSVECRLSGQMPECEYHAAIVLVADDFDPERAGRWCIDGIDSEGLPSLTRADEQP